MTDLVLLTGISGFLGGHIALELLTQGFRVRGSVRSLDKAEHVRTTLASHGADVSRLEFVALDLLSDTGWPEAMAGVRYLQHTASPFVVSMPDDKMELIRPAVEGTERALHAAVANGVERIVLTSSMAAIAYGHDTARTEPFTDRDWTNLNGRGVNAYIESKTLAEMRAWEIMRAAGRETDLISINPSAILGPLLDDDPGTSAQMVKRLIDGSIPALPRIPFVIVDVKDVAEAHVKAMTAQDAGGRRFAMGAATMFMSDIAQTVRAAAGAKGSKVPTLKLPDIGVRLFALFDRDVRGLVNELGVVKVLDSRPVEALLGHPLTPADASIAATTTSLIARGLV